MDYKYIYPQNLKAQAKLWFWNFRDIAIIGVALLVSVLSLTQIQFYLPLALTLVYAFLTIRMEESTVLEFIFRATRFFLTTQQYYEWKEESVGSHNAITEERR